VEQAEVTTDGWSSVRRERYIAAAKSIPASNKALIAARVKNAILADWQVIQWADSAGVFMSSGQTWVRPAGTEAGSAKPTFSFLLGP
jgi:hypothetical protein